MKSTTKDFLEDTFLRNIPKGPPPYNLIKSSPQLITSLTRKLNKKMKNHNRVFVDTNIFYSILFRTDRSERALKILEGIENPVTSITVVNEFLYVSLRKTAERKFGIRSYRDFRSLVGEKGYKPFEKEIASVAGLLEDSAVSIIADHQDFDELIEVMWSYNLLPTDAQIALTCRASGIRVIATFDRDFERVPWLQILK